MAEWYDKKLSDLSEEDKFDMLGEMKELLKEFYKTTKYGKIDDVELIARTIMDTFAILVFSNDDNDDDSYTFVFDQITSTTPLISTADSYELESDAKTFYLL